MKIIKIMLLTISRFALILTGSNEGPALCSTDHMSSLAGNGCPQSENYHMEKKDLKV